MLSKTIIISGAGFSAPANFPVQNRIIEEMLKNESDEFINISEEKQSTKFLIAYIEVGLFLLFTYGDSYELFHELYKNITRSIERSKTIYSFLNKWNLLTNLESNIVDQFSKELILVLSSDNEFVLDENDYYKNLEILKEKIRKKLVEINLDVSLEDVFTSFDKAIILKENRKRYTYQEMDNVRHSILRLFIYYFGKITKEYNFEQAEYMRIMKFTAQESEKLTIISTNWDTLWEGYFQKNRLEYNLCFTNKYFKYDNYKKNKQDKNKKVNLIKVHGSINWFKCLDCGGLSIIEKVPFGNFLFEDNSVEKCLLCENVSNSNSILIQPEIVTPTMIKSIENQLYKNLWKAASYELMQAKKIIFIGYSLPIADFEFRMLLQKNVSAMTEIDVVLYKNDNPENFIGLSKGFNQLLPEKRFLDVFRRNKPNFFYDGFDDYFKNEYKID